MKDHSLCIQIRTVNTNTYIKGSMLVLVMINKWRLFSCVAMPSLATKLSWPSLRAAVLTRETRDSQMQVMDNLSREKFSKHRIQLMVLGMTMHDSQPRGTLVACT